MRLPSVSMSAQSGIDVRLWSRPGIADSRRRPPRSALRRSLDRSSVFLVSRAIYSGQPQTVEARRANLLGFARRRLSVSAISSKNRSVHQTHGIAISIVDGANRAIGSTGQPVATERPASSARWTTVLSIAGRRWNLTLPANLPAFEASRRPSVAARARDRSPDLPRTGDRYFWTNTHRAAQLRESHEALIGGGDCRFARKPKPLRKRSNRANSQIPGKHEPRKSARR
jgi:hypothetical protein